MQLIISTTGGIRCVYAEAIDLGRLGELAIRRASHVEPTADGGWIADLSPVAGPTLGPFSSRSLALIAEAAWLEANWLAPSRASSN